MQKNKMLKNNNELSKKMKSTIGKNIKKQIKLVTDHFEF